MYPDPNVPPWEIPILNGLQSPRIPREHNKYHWYIVIIRGTPNCPLIPETNSLHLEIDAWKITFLLGRLGLFSGFFVVSLGFV